MANSRHIHNGVHLLHLVEGYSVNEKFIPKVDKIVILLHICYDLFFYIWKEFQAIVEHDGKIAVFSGWKLVSVPEYYICKNKGDDFYTILRYNSNPIDDKSY